MTDWWRNAVIYQVYVRSFADGNGDGVGDLIGVRDRLPYLAGLGVDALWLTPFYPSPMADFGYDVADHCDVDPLFGTLADAKALIDEAHGHGLRIIVDLVPNHTSAAHPWFQQALRGERRERYIFRDTPNDWESIFGGSAWTQVEDGQWYLHLFDPSQPDLNWDDQEVRGEFESILRFWLDLGVDGFRVDVAHGMVKPRGLPDIGRGDQATMVGREPVPFFDNDEVHEIHRSWRRVLDSYPGERIGVAEAWAPTPERLANYVRPDELHQAFNFHYLFASWDAAELRAVIDASLATSASAGAPHHLGAVEPRRQAARHPLRQPGEGARRRAAHARAARLGLRLQRRGAGPARGARPAARAVPGPAAAARPRQRPRRLPRAAALDARRRLARPLAAHSRRLGGAQRAGPGRCARLDLGAVPCGAAAAPRPHRRPGLARLSRGHADVLQGGPVVCAVNLTAAPVDFGVDGTLLVASDVPGAGDSAAWWKVKCQP
ncbi:hypothetical protein GCM10020001_086550 [Nonomuraea salmonea]